MDELKEYKTTLVSVLLITIAIVGTLALVQKNSVRVRLQVLQPDTRIYKNSEPYTQNSQSEQTVTLSLKEGEHTLLADADGRWPWKKDIRVTDANHTKEWSVFLLPRRPPATTITAEDGSFQSIKSMFEDTDSLPTQSAPLISTDERVAVWIQDDTSTTTLKAEHLDGPPLPAFCNTGTCTETITGFQANNEISHIKFFQGTNDLLIYAAGDRVVVRELDPDGTQNIQPVFVGTSPTFRLGTSTREVYIQESSGRIHRLQL